MFLIFRDKNIINVHSQRQQSIILLHEIKVDLQVEIELQEPLMSSQEAHISDRRFAQNPFRPFFKFAYSAFLLTELETLSTEPNILVHKNER